MGYIDLQDEKSDLSKELTKLKALYSKESGSIKVCI